MSEKTVDRWVIEMKTQFSNFNPFIAARVEEALLKSIYETLRQKLQDPKNKDQTATLTMPFGDITADIRAKNGQDNVNIGVVFSKDFIRALNGEIESVWQNDYDEAFLANFTDYVAYGFFDPESDKNKKRVESCQKCLKMREPEKEFFPSAWTNMIISIAKDKQRDGKIYTLDLDSTWDAGSFVFEFKDNEIVPTYNASKTAKQYLKNGDLIEHTDSDKTEDALDSLAV